MKTGQYIFLLSYFLMQNIPGYTQTNPHREDWIQLFNGQNLEHWIPKITGHDLGNNFAGTFRVKNGFLVVNYDQYNDFNGQFGHIFYDKPFSYYKIRVEYRFIGEQAPGGPDWAFRNSGIMIHCQSPESTALDQDFPISIEVQLLGGDGQQERPTANVCTPGTNIVMDDTLETQHCFTSSSKTYHGDQWVTVEAVVLGDSLITHYVNGEEVIHYTRPQIGGGVVNNYYDWAKQDGQPLTGGYISLQSESHPIEFRTVELLNLEGCTDSRAKNYKSYYVKTDNSQCEY